MMLALAIDRAVDRFARHELLAEKEGCWDSYLSAAGGGCGALTGNDNRQGQLERGRPVRGI